VPAIFAKNIYRRGDRYMIQMQTVEIKIVNLLSSKVILRSSVIDLFEKIEKTPESEIVVDFESVYFMNHSFAHEYLVQKNKSQKTISEIHLSDDVQKMLEIVSRMHENDFK
jgi:hypothetical protein